MCGVTHVRNPLFVRGALNRILAVANNTAQKDGNKKTGAARHSFTAICCQSFFFLSLRLKRKIFGGPADWIMSIPFLLFSPFPCGRTMEPVMNNVLCGSRSVKKIHPIDRRSFPTPIKDHSEILRVSGSAGREGEVGNGDGLERRDRMFRVEGVFSAKKNPRSLHY